MSYPQAALVEPISVALGGIQRSGLRYGQPTLICGAGPIGLYALILARACGAYPIVVTDLATHKLQRAKELGADLTLCCQSDWDGERVGAEIKQLVQAHEEGLEIEIALECTGAQTSFYGAGYGQSELVREDVRERE